MLVLYSKFLLIISDKSLVPAFLADLDECKADSERLCPSANRVECVNHNFSQPTCQCKDPIHNAMTIATLTAATCKGQH